MNVKAFIRLTSPRQFHGFRYEHTIINKYRLIKFPNYNHPYDAKTLTGTPVQIKCAKLGSAIHLGSYLNNKNHQEDFILHIGFWRTQKQNIIKEKTLYINRRSWSGLFTFDQSHHIFTKFRSFTNSPKDDLRFKTFLKTNRALWAKKPIRLRFKRDHKRQKRLQCAIPYREFENYFLRNFKEINLDGSA